MWVFYKWLTNISWTRLWRQRFVRHLACSVRYSVVQINSSLLTVTLCPSDITTKYSVLFRRYNRVRLYFETSGYLSLYEEAINLLWKAKLSLYTPWRRRESRGVAPFILNLGTIWNWVVSFTHRPLYSQRKTSHALRIWGTGDGMDVLEMIKRPFPLTGVEPQFVQPMAYSLDQLRYFCS
jgi:hypothetical protein